MSFLSLFEHCDSRGKTIVSLLFAAINQTKKKTATSIMLRLSVLLFGYDDNRKRIQKERTQYAKMPVSSSLIFVSLFQFKCSSYIFCVRVCAMLPFYLSLSLRWWRHEKLKIHIELMVIVRYYCLSLKDCVPGAPSNQQYARSSSPPGQSGPFCCAWVADSNEVDFGIKVTLRSSRRHCNFSTYPIDARVGRHSTWACLSRMGLIQSVLYRKIKTLHPEQYRKQSA